MNDSKRVARSLIVLLAALLLVYVIFFDVHWDSLRITTNQQVQDQDFSLTWEEIDRMVYIDTTNQISNNNDSDAIYFPSTYQDRSDLTITKPDSQLVQAQNSNKDPLVVEVINTAPVPYVESDTVPDVVEDVQGRRFYSTDFLFWNTANSPTSINVWSSANPVWVNAWVSNTTVPQQNVVVNTQIDPAPSNANTDDVVGIQLANTRVWDGMLTVLQSLELDDDVEYILKDINNTHYIYLWKWAWDISALVSFLDGTSLDITDQISIQNNQLFGSKVTKVTLPSYKRNLKELMIISFGNWDSRFLQIDKDWYNQLQNKLYIKEQFEPYY